jgi:hypothetical protein
MSRLTKTFQQKVKAESEHAAGMAAAPPAGGNRFGVGGKERPEEAPLPTYGKRMLADGV